MKPPGRRVVRERETVGGELDGCSVERVTSIDKENRARAPE